MTFLMIQIIHRDIEKVNAIVSSLFEKKLIVDCNIIPSENLSFENGHLKTNTKILINVQANMNDWLKINNEISLLCPNETIPIIRLEVSSNQKYEQRFYNNYE